MTVSSIEALYADYISHFAWYNVYIQFWDSLFICTSCIAAAMAPSCSPRPLKVCVTIQLKSAFTPKLYGLKTPFEFVLEAHKILCKMGTIALLCRMWILVSVGGKQSRVTRSTCSPTVLLFEICKLIFEYCIFIFLLCCTHLRYINYPLCVATYALHA